MSSKRILDIDSVAKVLLQAGLINETQLELIHANGAAQAARLNGHRRSGVERRTRPGADQVSPAEVICSFNLEQAGDGKLLSEDRVTEIIAQAAGLDYLKLDPLKLNMDIMTEFVSRGFALKNMMVPVAKQGDSVTIAVADPFQTQAIEGLEQARKIHIKRVLASRSDILKILSEFFGFRASVMAAESEQQAGSDLNNLEQYFQMRGQQELEGNDKHIISAVDYLLQHAFDQRASDIHIEPKRNNSLIRFRVDGVLHNIHSIPKNLHPPIISRLKLLARMDLAEKRRPQDGRIKTEHQRKEVELRVSTLPVAFGEKMVIRIFNPDILMQELDKIGFFPREYQLYSSFIRRPNGIILVTGPTGSGKTTTLYSSLRTLASPETNIVTVEDPIEMVMEEFNQVGVQNAIDVTFSTVLRNILRQDPDIIMIGEIRDKDTAENAVQAALTGHLVLSTLHTNDAPSSITRLLDLGIPAFLLASTLIGVNAQRLVRRICSNCKIERQLSAEEIAYLQLDPENCQVWEGEGCSECRGTGYRGRTGIFEVMDFTESVKDALTEQTDLSKLQQVAVADGMVTLRQAAIRKLLEGETTLEEVLAVTG